MSANEDAGIMVALAEAHIQEVMPKVIEPVAWRP
jgi:hypothetical protein